MKLDKRHFLNYSILIPYLILSVIGLIVVYSTTSAVQIQSGYSPYGKVLGHAVFWVISLLLIFMIYRMRLSFLRKTGIISVAILVELGLFIASYFFPTINGAHGWISLGGVSIQPAEYLKLIIVWFLAHKFARIQEDIGIKDYQALTKGVVFPRQLNDWRMISALFLILLVTFPDLGNATIIALIIVIMVTISGIHPKWFLTSLFSIFVLFSVLFNGIRIIGVETMEKIPIFGYIAKRFSAYFNPFEDVSNSGHQLANSYYAMSNGGWFGLGLGNSIEKNGYLPEAHTDFVFSIVIEELGLIGASLILALLFFLILRVIVVGINARNPFNAMMALGIGGMLLVQTFVNIGGISGLIPSTGVTFPFLSQGGNSLLTISVGIAFVLNIDANEKRERFKEEIERTLYH